MHQTESFEADEAEPAPSVESDNPEERIKARRLRIAERNEAKKGYAIISLAFSIS